ncbi:tRNA modification GTPase [Candidatus Uzinura diaspidicola str. ASNER]|uniref:tRNA modification GTPase MnmE n=1 Tax=Candidatus Uzinura diaspidicola str. ASNER TaxID=1133592 RepID=L7VJV4_9FLAO|nr:tRNA modification GTPase [Candidatus Uzinura diaspidicola str. ASNER]
MLDKDTIVALATSDGHGAIAVIRISGSEAFSTLSNIFRPLKKVNTKERITLGFILDKEERVDQVIVTSFKAPKSYTGENLIEVSCHGSPYIYRRILHLLIKTGIRMANPGEFTMRAFLNRKMDLAQAEAVSDLIASESQVDYKLALTQFEGETYKNIKVLRRKFIDFASIIEISIDFSEENVERPNYSKLSTFLLQAKEHIQHLLNSFHLGNAIKEGIQVVIIGGPNVGKSTLLNSLVKYDRAIVSDIPGTTRDFIEETIFFNGIRLRLIDTAGIRHTKENIETIGIQLTYDKVSNAQVILYLFDAMHYNTTKILKEFSNIDRKFSINIIIIANKYDVSSKKLFLNELAGKYYNISAKNKEGIDELLENIYNLLDKRYFKSNTVILNVRHLELLKKTLSTVNNIYYGIEQGSTDDLIASDIRKALYFLGKISGEITTNDLLVNIFSKFCIGK